MGASSRARIDRVDANARRIERDLREWVARRRKRDSSRLGQRLSALEGTLSSALSRVGAGTQLSTAASPGSVYRAALAQERRLALIERMFLFFRDRFDQRDSPHLQPLLAAADEVVYSLYAQPFRAANLPVPPPPVAYVEPAYSPRAVARDEPPSDLRTPDEVLRTVLTELPVGVVGLPPWCEEGPWTLLYLAHEIGHHVEVDLAPGRALVKRVRDTLSSAAETAQVPNADRFRVWSREIFADAFSIAMIGPDALESISELERGDDAALVVASDAAYPSPVVRLSLMSHLATSLGLDGARALGDIDPLALVGNDPNARSAQQATAAAYLAAVPAVAAALAAQDLLAGLDLAKLASLRPADFQDDGPVDGWDNALHDGKRRAPNQTLRGTRSVLAGCWRAWRRACAIEEDASRAEAIEKLRARAFDALSENGEPITLAGSVGANDAAKLGTKIGDMLLQLGPEALAC